MRLESLATLLALGLAGPVIADPTEDARFISKISYSDGIIDATFETLGPMIVDGVKYQLGAQNVTISDTDRYFTIFLEGFRGVFAERMRGEFEPVLRERFSDEELAGIADFFRSPAGRRYAAEMPELMRAGAAVGERVGGMAGIDAAPRIAARMEEEGITITGADGQEISPLKWMRGY
ncbi:MAG: DUF2059 domain-containing protein [Paracoccaceae bacterium]